MGEDKRKVPKLRFPEFGGEWEEKRLGEVSKIVDGDRGKNYPSVDDFTRDGHTLFLSANNVTKKGFLFENNQYISKEKSNSLGNGKLNCNDIVITSRGSIGHVAWYNSEIESRIPYARINSGMLIVRTNDDIEVIIFLNI